MTDYLRDRVTAAVGAHYLIEGELGRGGMAVVYRALDVRLSRPVAIKVLPPDLAFNADVRERFLREAQTAAQLNHANIVPIYTVDETEGLVYFVMALVHGESLAARLAREPRLPVADVRRILCSVADALAYAHAHGVVHRDIKPDNILLEDGSDRVWVTDFGIARAAQGEQRLTVTGVAVGTPAYMSPEQALGEREVDGRSDLYSLGIVGYQMVTGETPFKAMNTPAMLVKHVSETPRPIAMLRADAPADLAAAIEKSLAKKPHDRWPTAEAMRDAIMGTGDRRAEPRPAVREQRPGIAGRADDVRNPYADLGDAPVRLPRLGDPETFVVRGPTSPPPFGADRDAWRQWALAQRDAVRQSRDGWRGERLSRREMRRRMREEYDDRPLEVRVMAFRRTVISNIGVSALLFSINAATGGFPWSLFAIGFLGLDVARRASSLWADGIGPIEAFSKGIRKRLRAEDEAREVAAGRRGAALPAAPAGGRAQRAIAPAMPVAPQPQVPAWVGVASEDVLAGAHGDVVRRAAGDRQVVRDIVGKLGPVEREMIPDVAPTVDALVERVAGLATTLHRLDADVSGSSLGQLDQRIAALEKETATADRDRRLSLLQRQRASLHDLLQRRSALAAQLESASLALQNLKLDMLKLRSAGVDAAIGDVTSATQEARALSRDIGHVLDAADDLRKLR